MRPRVSPNILSAERQCKLDLRILAYALGAAGSVALTQPAKAQIVFTKVNVTLSNGILPVDLDGDGHADFALHNYWVGSSSSIQAITIKGNPTNSMAAVIGRKKTIFNYAVALPLNYSIGSGISKSFVALHGAPAYLSTHVITNKFLGLRFSINGQTHYGWARITVSGGFQQKKIQLTGYAYEQTPNKSILAGDRGPLNDGEAELKDFSAFGPSLGVLSAGAAGLPLWRPGLQ
jgi:hypothetical protein